MQLTDLAASNDYFKASKTLGYWERVLWFEERLTPVDPAIRAKLLIRHAQTVRDDTLIDTYRRALSALIDAVENVEPKDDEGRFAHAKRLRQVAYLMYRTERSDEAMPQLVRARKQLALIDRENRSQVAIWASREEQVEDVLEICLKSPLRFRDKLCRVQGVVTFAKQVACYLSSEKPELQCGLPADFWRDPESLVAEVNALRASWPLFAEYFERFFASYLISNYSTCELREKVGMTCESWDRSEAPSERTRKLAFYFPVIAKEANAIHQRYLVVRLARELARCKTWTADSAEECYGLPRDEAVERARGAIDGFVPAYDAAIEEELDDLTEFSGTCSAERELGYGYGCANWRREGDVFPLLKELGGDTQARRKVHAAARVKQLKVGIVLLAYCRVDERTVGSTETCGSLLDGLTPSRVEAVLRSKFADYDSLIVEAVEQVVQERAQDIGRRLAWNDLIGQSGGYARNTHDDQIARAAGLRSAFPEAGAMIAAARREQIAARTRVY